VAGKNATKKNLLRRCDDEISCFQFDIAYAIIDGAQVVMKASTASH
jgi:hypothetical protein